MDDLQTVLLAVVLAIPVVGVYFVPTVVAVARRWQVGPVFVVNLFFGWTVIGWAVALAMALSKKAWTFPIRLSPPSRNQLPQLGAPQVAMTKERRWGRSILGVLGVSGLIVGGLIGIAIMGDKPAMPVDNAAAEEGNISADAFPKATNAAPIGGNLDPRSTAYADAVNANAAAAVEQPYYHPSPGLFGGPGSIEDQLADAKQAAADAQDAAEDAKRTAEDAQRTAEEAKERADSSPY